MLSLSRHLCRGDRDVLLPKEGLSEEQGWESWAEGMQYTLCDAIELLRLERLVGTRHAKLAKPNQNFTHRVSISAPRLTCQHEGFFDSQACSGGAKRLGLCLQGSAALSGADDGIWCQDFQQQNESSRRSLQRKDVNKILAMQFSRVNIWCNV